MQLGAEMRRHLLVGRVIGVREGDVPKIALAHAERAELWSAGKAREVERVTLELDDRWVASAAFHALYAAIDQHQERSASGFDDLAIFGERSCSFVGIAP